MDTNETLLPPSIKSDEFTRIDEQNKEIEKQFVKNIPEKEEEPCCVTCCSSCMDLCLPCGFLCFILGHR
jgi:hypothetical protein